MPCLLFLHPLISRRSLHSVFLLLSLALMSLSARAGDRIIERAWFEDRSGVLTIEEVKGREFQAYSGVLAKGFGRSVYWVRLLIDTPPVEQAGRVSSHEAYVMRVTPSQLDLIELYDPSVGGRQPKRGGDHTSWSEQEHPSLFTSFYLASSEKPRYVWIRVQTTSSRLINVEIHSFSEMQREDVFIEMMAGCYLGLLLLFFGWALNAYIVDREPLLVWFLLKQFGALIYALFLLGYLRMYFDSILSPVDIDRMTKITMILYSWVAAIYQMVLLKELDPPAWTLAVYRWILNILPLSLILLLFDYPIESAVLNGLAVMLFIALGVTMTALGRYPVRQGEVEFHMLPKGVMVTLHLLVFASAFFSVGPLFGGGETSAYAVYAPLMHAILSGVILMVIIQVRSIRLIRHQARISAQYENLNEKIELERSFREEQQHLLAMLAHEIKTPLAAIAMLAAKAVPTSTTMNNIKTAVSETTRIVDRSIQAGWLHGPPQALKAQTFEPVSILKQLLEARANDRRIQLNVESSSVICSDQQLIRLLLSNLLENACRYGAVNDPVHIHVSLHSQDGHAGILFRFTNSPGDAGWPDPKRIFTKYYRSSHAQRRTGSGLGLYLVQGFVKRLGGSVAYVPTQHEIVFELWLPL